MPHSPTLVCSTIHSYFFIIILVPRNNANANGEAGDNHNVVDECDNFDVDDDVGGD